MVGRTQQHAPNSSAGFNFAFALSFFPDEAAFALAAAREELALAAASVVPVAVADTTACSTPTCRTESVSSTVSHPFSTCLWSFGFVERARDCGVALACSLSPKEASTSACSCGESAFSSDFLSILQCCWDLFVFKLLFFAVVVADIRIPIIDNGIRLDVDLSRRSLDLMLLRNLSPSEHLQIETSIGNEFGKPPPSASANRYYCRFTCDRICKGLFTSRMHGNPREEGY